MRRRLPRFRARLRDGLVAFEEPENDAWVDAEHIAADECNEERADADATAAQWKPPPAAAHVFNVAAFTFVIEAHGRLSGGLCARHYSLVRSRHLLSSAQTNRSRTNKTAAAGE